LPHSSIHSHVLAVSAFQHGVQSNWAGSDSRFHDVQYNNNFHSTLSRRNESLKEKHPHGVASFASHFPVLISVAGGKKYLGPQDKNWLADSRIFVLVILWIDSDAMNIPQICFDIWRFCDKSSLERTWDSSEHGSNGNRI